MNIQTAIVDETDALSGQLAGIAIWATVSDAVKAKKPASADEAPDGGALLRGGTIVDATLIAASPSTKNKEQKRDPEMRQSKKGNQWYFGMKVVSIR